MDTKTFKKIVDQYDYVTAEPGRGMWRGFYLLRHAYLPDSGMYVKPSDYNDAELEQMIHNRRKSRLDYREQIENMKINYQRERDRLMAAISALDKGLPVEYSTPTPFYLRHLQKEISEAEERYQDMVDNDMDFDE